MTQACLTPRFDFTAGNGRLRAILITEAFDQAWDEGRAMSFDDAVRYALDEQAGRDN